MCFLTDEMNHRIDRLITIQLGSKGLRRCSIFSCPTIRPLSPALSEDEDERRNLGGVPPRPMCASGQRAKLDIAQEEPSRAQPWMVCPASPKISAKSDPQNASKRSPQGVLRNNRECNICQKTQNHQS